MARHSQPRELAKLKGADKAHPERYQTEPPKHGDPLGPPPDHMQEAAQAVWFEVEALSLPGVLTAADRFMVEISSNLLAEYRAAPTEFSIGKYTHMVGILARMGLSPSDRQKLAVDKPKADDEDDFEFLN